MSDDQKIWWLGFFIGIVGYALIAAYGSWELGAGVMLVVVSHSIEKHRSK